MKTGNFAALWREFEAFLAMETPYMTWGEFLKDYQDGRLPLFSEAFMHRWEDEPWEPNDDDRNAAAKLHTQVTSRITTQRLGYLDGVEKTALESCMRSSKAHAT